MLLVTGGLMMATNASITVGDDGVGSLTVSNGEVQALSIKVGSGLNFGTLTSVGGTISVSSSLILGTFACDATGVVSVVGGNLYVTNATHSAVLEVRSGTVIVSGGTVEIDNLVITNACGHLMHTGGALSITTTNLGAGLDADSDGLPNDWEQAHGLNPLEATGDNGASGDPDHDGFTNLQEYLAGTNPNDPASTPLRITSIAQQGDNVLLTWTTAGGKTNVVQATAGASGNYSNNFLDLSPMIIPSGGLTSTNYLDTGGATNRPSRYYHVKMTM
jgi:hypothetical protein